MDVEEKRQKVRGIGEKRLRYSTYFSVVVRITLASVIVSGW